ARQADALPAELTVHILFCCSQLNYDSIGWNKNQALFAKIFKKSFQGLAGTPLPEGRESGRRLGVKRLSLPLFYRCAIIR
ncbi:MAG: hypothetical protein ACLSGP_10835, partial [Faecalibacterium prausnitzii]